MSRIIYRKELSSINTLFPLTIELERQIDATHPVRIINSVVDMIDLSTLMRSYKGGGASSYNPRTLLKIIIYSYISNIYSGRRMEQLLHENIHFMWLSGMITPDFRTINRFRSQRLKDQIETIFTKIVELLHEKGLVSLQVQYIDGTKIESVANKYTFVWRKNIERFDTHFRNKVSVILQQAQQTLFSEEELCADSLKDLTSEQIEKKLDAVLAELEHQATSADLVDSIKRAKEEIVPKISEYEQKRDNIGDRNSYSTKDIDATFMRMKEDHMGNGQLKPAYNVQIATENQFITNFGLYQRPGDTATLISFMDSFKQKYGFQSGVVVADAGYGSEQNYDYLQRNGVDDFVKFAYFHKEQKRSYKTNPFLRENLFYNAKDDFFVCPMGQRMEKCYERKTTSDLGYESTVWVYKAKRCLGCPLKGECIKKSEYQSDNVKRSVTLNHNLEQHKERARQNLNSYHGRYHRSRRPVEPEAVFGQIKYNRKFNRFLTKGVSGTSVEFGLVAIAHNLAKLAKLSKIA